MNAQHPEPEGQRSLPWWTWVLPFFIFHAGTQLSLHAKVLPGVAVAYYPTALGIVLIHWWGRRVLLGLYINALACVPLWDLPMSHAPLYALPETLTVFLSWLFFAKIRSGDCALNNRRNALEMMFFGMALPEFIAGMYLHLQLVYFGHLGWDQFYFGIGTGFLSDLLAFFALAVPLMVYFTVPLRNAGLAISRHATTAVPFRAAPQMFSSNLVVGVVCLILLLVSLKFPIQHFWFLYAVPVLAAALLGGFNAAVLSLSWLFVLVLFIPATISEKFSASWMQTGDSLQIYWNLFLVSVAALITGRTITDLRLAGEMQEETSRSLRLKEGMIEALVENSPTVIFLKDLEGRNQVLNGMYAKVVGKPRQELLGRTDYEIFPSEVADSLRKNDLVALQSATPMQYEELVPGPAGTRRYLSIKFALRDAMGKAYAICGIATDITDLASAREHLEKSEQFLKAALESALMGVWSWDVTTNAVRWSEGMEALMGKAPGSFKESYAEVHTTVLPEDLPSVTAAIDFALKGPDNDYRVQYRVRRQDGNVYWIEARGRVTRDATGKALGMTGTVKDITASKSAEDKLLQSQKQLSSIIETAPNMAIQLYDRQGRVQQWNKASEVMFGFSAEEALGKTLEHTIHTPEESQAFIRMLGEIEASGQPVGPAEYPFRRRDGSRGFCLSTTFVLPDTGIFVCMDIDITERKKLDEHLLQSQKVESIGRLAGGVAHDFNNLLTSILGYSDMLRAQAVPGSTEEIFLKRIKEAAQRGGSLTQQLLGYARRQVAQPLVLNMNERVLKATDLLKRLIGEDVELAFFPGDDLGRVKVDPVQIEQVLMNLAVNARDAMPKGGKLTIETMNVTLDEDYARTRQDVTPGEFVMLAVSDTGSGIPAEVLPKIFDPFFTTKPVGQGTGLGLATCYGIIKQYDGHISVYSEAGRGTTFKVYLPRTYEGATLLNASDSALSPATPGDETILLVEDDSTIREMVATALRDSGYIVVQAAHGIEALEKAETMAANLRLLITDVVMPKMGGKDLATRLQEKRPNLKVLYTSGYTENAIVHHGVLDEGIHFLQKPYTPAVLMRKVREVLDNK